MPVRVDPIFLESVAAEYGKETRGMLPDEVLSALHQAIVRKCLESLYALGYGVVRPENVVQPTLTISAHTNVYCTANWGGPCTCTA